jgi:hypothetical protein
VLFAGGMLKAMGDFDKAGSYFFEAMNMGPPRLFSRLDMMFIVARTLEESTADRRESTDQTHRIFSFFGVNPLISTGTFNLIINYYQ